MSADDGLAWALRYAAAGLLIFPVNANKKPLTTHGFKDATSDPAAIEAWRRKWPHCEFGWAVPAGVVVVDVDIKHGKNGYADFKRLAGCDPRDVADAAGHDAQRRAAPLLCGVEAVQERGGDRRDRHRYPRRGRLRRAAAAGNGREWLRPLIGADGAMAPLLPRRRGSMSR